MHALSYNIPCSESRAEGRFRFEMRLADERRVDVTVLNAEDDSVVSGTVRTDPTSLYKVIHGWPVEARDKHAGLLQIREQQGTVWIRYERFSDNLRFEGHVGSEDYARRVNSLGGPMLF